MAPENRPNYVPDVGYYSELSDGDGELTDAVVRCWTGSIDERPEDADGNFDQETDRSFEKTKSIDTGEPNSISQTVNTEGYSGYACEWAYETTDDIGEDGDALARGKAEDVIALHQNQHQNKWEQISENFDINDNEFPQN